MNICFEYLYRDAANYKNWGEAILATSSGLDLEEIDRRFKAALINEVNFVAEDVDIPTQYFSKRDVNIDHWWHEYSGISWTNRDITSERTVEELIAAMEISQLKFRELA